MHSRNRAAGRLNNRIAIRLIIFHRLILIDFCHDIHHSIEISHSIHLAAIHLKCTFSIGCCTTALFIYHPEGLVHFGRIKRSNDLRYITGNHIDAIGCLVSFQCATDLQCASNSDRIHRLLSRRYNRISAFLKNCHSCLCYSILNRSIIVLNLAFDADFSTFCYLLGSNALIYEECSLFGSTTVFSVGNPHTLILVCSPTAISVCHTFVIRQCSNISLYLVILRGGLA